MRLRPERRAGGEDGVVMLLVLVIIVLSVTSVGAFARSAVLEVMGMRGRADRGRAELLARSGVAVAMRVLKDDLSNEDLTVSVEDAIRLNASCMAISVFVGSDHEKQTLTNLAKLCDQGQKYGIPVLAVTAVGKDMVRDARYLGLACRIAAEIGAHVVKTYFCEGFVEVVHNTPVPIVIAGGKKIPEREAIQLAHDAVAAGASGVDMGRNIFQSDCPVGMIRAVRAVVHECAGADDAHAIYREEKERSGAGRGIPR